MRRSGSVVVIGYSIMESLFPHVDAIGKEVMISGRRYTVVGVMPKGFEIFGLPSDGFLPFRDLPAAREPRGRSLIGLGRLKPGLTLQQAQAEMEGVFASLVRDWPDFNTGWTVNLVPLREGRDFFEKQTVLTRSDLAAIEIAERSVEPSFRLSPEAAGTVFLNEIEAGEYLQAVDEFGSPAYSPADLAAGFDAVIAERRLLRDVPPDHIDRFLALICGYFLRKADEPVPVPAL